MTTALKIPAAYFRKNYVSLLVLMLIVLPLMLLSCAGLFHLIFALDWHFCFLLAAIITPTDPIISATIVSSEKAKKTLPQLTRNTIYGDSGINDGLAMPFVLLAMYFFIDKPGLWKEWTLHILLWKTIGGVALGLLTGWFAGRILEWSINKQLTSHEAVLAFSVSVSLFILGAFELAGLNSIIGVFAAGVILRGVMARREEIEEGQIQSMLERLFFIPVFVFFGLVILWDEWLSIGWSGLLAVLGVIFFRRLPFLLLLKNGVRGLKWKDAAFIGWFGPVGGAAMFYSFYCIKHTGDHRIWAYTSLVIFSSILVHGATASPMISWYGKTLKGKA